VAVAKELLRGKGLETSAENLRGQDVRAQRRKPVRNDSGSTA